MMLVHVFRSEFALDPHNPFEGIELLGIVDTDDEANKLIDRYAADHPHWTFHIDPVTFETLKQWVMP